MKKKYTFVTIMLTICSFLLGVWCTNSFGSTKVKDSRLQVFIEIYETLKDNWYYGDEETLDKIMNQVYSSIYDYNTDPYTFFTAAPIEGDKEQQTYGIGIVAVLNYDAEQENYNDPILNELGLLVIKTYQDSPSNKYGIKPLDYIVGIEENGNYISFEGKKYSEIRQYIVGELNSQTTFKIKRDNQELDIEVKRHSYTPESVTINNNLKDLYPNVEILQIEEFKESTGNEVGEILEKIQRPETKDLVIDLRDNPGGYVYSMANVASYFLEAGLPVLTYEDRNGNKYIAEKTSNKKTYDFNSITMLLNGNSASASEALTLCLDYYKDYLNAFQIVGTKSYGKGIAQTSINLSNGASLRYTFAKVYDPGGEESIHQKGITPDVEIPIEEHLIGDAMGYYNNFTNQLKKACQLATEINK